MDDWSRQLEEAEKYRRHKMEDENRRLREQVRTLREACMYPRFGDTAVLLEKAADDLDRKVTPGWQHLYTPHFRRAAQCIRAAIAATAEHEQR